VVILILQMVGSAVSAQAVIKGKVIDKTTREPLELAVVVAGRQGEKILTDKNGLFLLKNIHRADSISISFIGYKTLTMMVPAGHAMITVPLEKGVVDLKEIVISSHSNNLTTSHILSSIDLNMQPVKSAQDLLRFQDYLLLNTREAVRRNKYS